VPLLVPLAVIVNLRQILWRAALVARNRRWIGAPCTLRLLDGRDVRSDNWFVWVGRAPTLPSRASTAAAYFFGPSLYPRGRYFGWTPLYSSPFSRMS
jgi:hypothetical protein